jgi:hypothetical protein
MRERNAALMWHVEDALRSFCGSVCKWIKESIDCGKGKVWG